MGGGNSGGSGLYDAMVKNWGVTKVGSRIGSSPNVGTSRTGVGGAFGGGGGSTAANKTYNVATGYENEGRTHRYKEKYVSADWKALQKELKELGYSIRDVKKEIKTNFGRQTTQGQNMRASAFKLLEGLLGRPIKHAIVKRDLRYTYLGLKLPEAKKMAEMVGILLGDGHLSKVGNQIVIALNSNEKASYAPYVQKLLRSTIGFNSKVHQVKDRNSIKIHGSEKRAKSILTTLGLHRGNKVKLQVGVPN